MSYRTKESFAVRSFICSDSCFQRRCEGRMLLKKGNRQRKAAIYQRKEQKPEVKQEHHLTKTQPQTSSKKSKTQTSKLTKWMHIISKVILPHGMAYTLYVLSHHRLNMDFHYSSRRRSTVDFQFFLFIQLLPLSDPLFCFSQFLKTTYYDVESVGLCLFPPSLWSRAGRCKKTLVSLQNFGKSKHLKRTKLSFLIYIHQYSDSLFIYDICRVALRYDTCKDLVPYVIGRVDIWCNWCNQRLCKAFAVSVTFSRNNVLECTNKAIIYFFNLLL